LHPFAIEPLTADFPYARTLIVLRSERTVKKTSLTSTESRYYLSSAPAQEYRPEQWLNLIRGHWAGVEIRNHWRRDVLMGEDGSRSRNANLLANVALIRNALLQILSEHIGDQSLPKFQENLHSRPGQCLALVAAP
jgi:predicted transposase YbfD/YdcC